MGEIKLNVILMGTEIKFTFAAIAAFTVPMRPRRTSETRILRLRFEDID